MPLWPVNRDTRRLGSFTRCRKGWEELRTMWNGPLALVVACGLAAACHRRITVSGHRGWHLKVRASCFRFHDHNGTIGLRWKWPNFNTLFEVNCQNFDSWFEPNETLFSGNNLKLLIVTKNNFQRFIICLYLGSFAQNHVFRDSLQIVNLNLVSFYVQGQPGLQIRKRRTCFDAMNVMVALEFQNESLLEITFFEVSHLTRFSWNCYNLWFGAPFWKPSIPLD